MSPEPQTFPSSGDWRSCFIFRAHGSNSFSRKQSSLIILSGPGSPALLSPDCSCLPERTAPYSLICAPASCLVPVPSGAPHRACHLCSIAASVPEHSLGSTLCSELGGGGGWGGTSLSLSGVSWPLCILPMHAQDGKGAGRRDKPRNIVHQDTRCSTSF